MAEHPGWEPVIGLEIHVQLATRTKLFTGAAAAYGAPPNTNIDPVTVGMPGVLPVLNREAVELALRLGLALGCTIRSPNRFARKHYFYPDLPKGYQISQFEAPICEGGAVRALIEGEVRSFALTRIHLEEDAGKLIHDPQRDQSLVDYNRAGVPLVETVSEPDLRSADEAWHYMKALHGVVTWLGVSDGNMERGNFRCDANVSVRRHGEPLGTRVELKNINSFRFVRRGLEFEIDRQIRVLEGGGEVVQETRLWDDEAGRTRTMRTKEEAHDYRYFPDPDLMPVEIDEAWQARVRAELPELPLERRARFESELGLSAYDAGVLTQTRSRADYFEAVVAAGGEPRDASSWIQTDVLALTKGGEARRDEAPVSPEPLGALLGLVAKGTISQKMAKTCFREMVVDPKVDPEAWVAEHGGQISDATELESIATRILDANPAEVQAWLGGKTKVLAFFVGQVMRETRGKANPQLASKTLRDLLEARR